MRHLLPLRIWVWTAATSVAVVVAVLLWDSSDAAATSSTTSAAAGAVTGAPGAVLSAAWSAVAGGRPPTDRPEDPLVAGRVLVTGDHGVRVLDPVSGTPAWHYTRSNARLCDATAVDDRVVAVFSTGGRCNEIVALDGATGRRAWYRTIGFSRGVRLSSTEGIVLATTPTGIATVDPAGNAIRWRYSPPRGCTIADAAAGSTGVAVVQRCADPPTVSVRLLDGFSGAVRWTHDLPVARTAPGGAGGVRLSGADLAVGVVSGDALRMLSTVDGAELSSTPLPPGSDPATEPLAQTGSGTTALVYARGTVSAVSAATGALGWQVPAAGLPAPATDGGVLVPEGGALVHRDLVTGAERGRSTLPAPAPQGVVTAVSGPVVVLAGSDAVRAYR